MHQLRSMGNSCLKNADPMEEIEVQPSDGGELDVILRLTISAMPKPNSCRTLEESGSERCPALGPTQCGCITGVTNVHFFPGATVKLRAAEAYGKVLWGNLVEHESHEYSDIDAVAMVSAKAAMATTTAERKPGEVNPCSPIAD